MPFKCLAVVLPLLFSTHLISAKPLARRGIIDLDGNGVPDWCVENGDGSANCLENGTWTRVVTTTLRTTSRTTTRVTPPSTPTVKTTTKTTTTTSPRTTTVTKTTVPTTSNRSSTISSATTSKTAITTTKSSSTMISTTTKTSVTTTTRITGTTTSSSKPTASIPTTMSLSLKSTTVSTTTISTSSRGANIPSSTTILSPATSRTAITTVMTTPAQSTASTTSTMSTPSTRISSSSSSTTTTTTTTNITTTTTMMTTSTSTLRTSSLTNSTSTSTSSTTSTKLLTTTTTTTNTNTATISSSLNLSSSTISVTSSSSPTLTTVSNAVTTPDLSSTTSVNSTSTITSISNVLSSTSLFTSTFNSTNAISTQLFANSSVITSTGSATLPGSVALNASTSVITGGGNATSLANTTISTSSPTSMITTLSTTNTIFPTTSMSTSTTTTATNTTTTTTTTTTLARGLPAPSAFSADKGTKWNITMIGNLQYSDKLANMSLNGDKCRTGMVAGRIMWSCGDMQCGESWTNCGFDMGPAFYGTSSVMVVNTDGITNLGSNTFVKPWSGDPTPQSGGFTDWGMDTSNVVPLDSTRSVVYAWEIWRSVDGSYSDRGNAVAIVTAGATKPIATRMGPLLTGPEAVQLGLVAIMRDGGYVYIYSESGPSRLVVTRVPATVNAVLDATQYEALVYGSNSTWTKGIPKRSDNTYGMTTDNGIFGCSVYGSVFYNTYLKKYVIICNIFMWWTNMYTSDTPWGPWSAEYQLLPGIIQGYGSHAHPEYGDGKDFYFSQGPGGVFNMFKVSLGGYAAP